MALTHLIVKGVEICAISEGKIKYKLHHCIFAPCFHLGDWLVATECPLSAYSPLFYSELVHNLIFSRWIESCRGWWPWSPSSPSSSATMDSPKECTSQVILFKNWVEVRHFKYFSAVFILRRFLCRCFWRKYRDTGKIKKTAFMFCWTILCFLNNFVNFCLRKQFCYNFVTGWNGEQW